MVFEELRSLWPAERRWLQQEFPEYGAELTVTQYDGVLQTVTERIDMDVETETGTARYKFIHLSGQAPSYNLTKRIDADVPSERFTGPDAGSDPISTAYLDASAVLGYDFMTDYPLRPANNARVHVSGFNAEERDGCLDVDVHIQYWEADGGYRTDWGTALDTMEQETGVPVREAVEEMLDEPDAYRHD